MYLKHRDEVLDNRAKYNELQVVMGTVATAQVMLGRLSEKTQERLQDEPSPSA